MLQEPHPHRSTALSLAAIALGMLMLAYASVPLYRLFCSVTGFGGTTQRAESVSTKILPRQITVRFNADIDPNLPWEFTPDQRSIKTHVGAQTLVSFSARNLTNQPISGNAVYNVTPHKAGPYFVKVQCFCFEEQTLKARERVHMPVSFFIDPSIMNDRSLDDVDTITLSYTFFQLKK